MDRETAFKALQTAAVDVLKVEESKVTESATFAEDLEADSLDLVELVMSLEDELDLAIDEEQLSDVRTVADALDAIMAAHKAAASA